MGSLRVKLKVYAELERSCYDDTHDRRSFLFRFKFDYAKLMQI